MVDNSRISSDSISDAGCLATQFVEQVKGMTNDEIVDYLADKPVQYVDNTCLDHSGEFFDPVKFYFKDGSIVYIFDWTEETPVMKVYEQLLTNKELINSFNDETGDFDHFCTELISSLHALAITDYPDHELKTACNKLPTQDLQLVLATPSFQYTLLIPDDDQKPNLTKLIGEITQFYRPYDPSDSTGLTNIFN